MLFRLICLVLLAAAAAAGALAAVEIVNVPPCSGGASWTVPLPSTPSEVVVNGSISNCRVEIVNPANSVQRSITFTGAFTAGASLSVSSVVCEYALPTAAALTPAHFRSGGAGCINLLGALSNATINVVDVLFRSASDIVASGGGASVTVRIVAVYFAQPAAAMRNVTLRNVRLEMARLSSDTNDNPLDISICLFAQSVAGDGAGGWSRLQVSDSISTIAGVGGPLHAADVSVAAVKFAGMDQFRAVEVRRVDLHVLNARVLGALPAPALALRLVRIEGWLREARHGGLRIDGAALFVTFASPSATAVAQVVSFGGINEPKPPLLLQVAYLEVNNATLVAKGIAGVPSVSFSLAVVSFSRDLSYFWSFRLTKLQLALPDGLVTTSTSVDTLLHVVTANTAVLRPFASLVVEDCSVVLNSNKPLSLAGRSVVVVALLLHRVEFGLAVEMPPNVTARQLRISRVRVVDTAATAAGGVIGAANNGIVVSEGRLQLRAAQWAAVRGADTVAVDELTIGTAESRMCGVQVADGRLELTVLFAQGGVTSEAVGASTASERTRPLIFSVTNSGAHFGGSVVADSFPTVAAVDFSEADAHLSTLRAFALENITLAFDAALTASNATQPSRVWVVSHSALALQSTRLVQATTQTTDGPRTATVRNLLLRLPANTDTATDSATSTVVTVNGQMGVLRVGREYTGFDEITVSNLRLDGGRVRFSTTSFATVENLGSVVGGLYADFGGFRTAAGGTVALERVSVVAWFIGGGGASHFGAVLFLRPDRPPTPLGPGNEMRARCSTDCRGGTLLAGSATMQDIELNANFSRTAPFSASALLLFEPERQQGAADSTQPMLLVRGVSLLSRHLHANDGGESRLAALSLRGNIGQRATVLVDGLRVWARQERPNAAAYLVAGVHHVESMSLGPSFVLRNSSVVFVAPPSDAGNLQTVAGVFRLGLFFGQRGELTAGLTPDPNLAPTNVSEFCVYNTSVLLDFHKDTLPSRRAFIAAGGAAVFGVVAENGFGPTLEARHFFDFRGVGVRVRGALQALGGSIEISGWRMQQSAYFSPPVGEWSDIDIELGELRASDLISVTALFVAEELSNNAGAAGADDNGIVMRRVAVTTAGMHSTASYIEFNAIRLPTPSGPDTASGLTWYDVDTVRFSVADSSTGRLVTRLSATGGVLVRVVSALHASGITCARPDLTSSAVFSVRNSVVDIQGGISSSNGIVEIVHVLCFKFSHFAALRIEDTQTNLYGAVASPRLVIIIGGIFLRGDLNGSVEENAPGTALTFRRISVATLGGALFDIGAPLDTSYVHIFAAGRLAGNVLRAESVTAEDCSINVSSSRILARDAVMMRTLHVDGTVADDLAQGGPTRNWPRAAISVSRSSIVGPGIENARAHSVLPSAVIYVAILHLQKDARQLRSVTLAELQLRGFAFSAFLHHFALLSLGALKVDPSLGLAMTAWRPHARATISLADCFLGDLDLLVPGRLTNASVARVVAFDARLPVADFTAITFTRCTVAPRTVSSTTSTFVGLGAFVNVTSTSPSRGELSTALSASFCDVRVDTADTVVDADGAHATVALFWIADSLAGAGSVTVEDSGVTVHRLESARRVELFVFCANSSSLGPNAADTFTFRRTALRLATSGQLSNNAALSLRLVHTALEGDVALLSSVTHEDVTVALAGAPTATLWMPATGVTQRFDMIVFFVGGKLDQVYRAVLVFRNVEVTVPPDTFAVTISATFAAAPCDRATMLTQALVSIARNFNSAASPAFRLLNTDITIRGVRMTLGVASIFTLLGAVPVSLSRDFVSIERGLVLIHDGAPPPATGVASAAEEASAAAASPGVLVQNCRIDVKDAVLSFAHSILPTGTPSSPYFVEVRVREDLVALPAITSTTVAVTNVSSTAISEVCPSLRGSSDSARAVHVSGDATLSSSIAVTNTTLARVGGGFAGAMPVLLSASDAAPRIVFALALVQITGNMTRFCSVAVADSALLQDDAGMDVAYPAGPLGPAGARADLTLSLTLDAVSVRGAKVVQTRFDVRRVRLQPSQLVFAAPGSDAAAVDAIVKRRLEIVGLRLPAPFLGSGSALFGTRVAVADVTLRLGYDAVLAGGRPPAGAGAPIFVNAAVLHAETNLAAALEEQAAYGHDLAVMQAGVTVSLRNNALLLSGLGGAACSSGSGSGVGVALQLNASLFRVSPYVMPPRDAFVMSNNTLAVSGVCVAAGSASRVAALDMSPPSAAASRADLAFAQAEVARRLRSRRTATAPPLLEQRPWNFSSFRVQVGPGPVNFGRQQLEGTNDGGEQQSLLAVFILDPVAGMRIDTANVVNNTVVVLFSAAGGSGAQPFLPAVSFFAVARTSAVPSDFADPRTLQPDQPDFLPLTTYEVKGNAVLMGGAEAAANGIPLHFVAAAAAAALPAVPSNAFRLLGGFKTFPLVPASAGGAAPHEQMLPLQQALRKSIFVLDCNDWQLAHLRDHHLAQAALWVRLRCSQSTTPSRSRSNTSDETRSRTLEPTPSDSASVTGGTRTTRTRWPTKSLSLSRSRELTNETNSTSASPSRDVTASSTRSVEPECAPLLTIHISPKSPSASMSLLTQTSQMVLTAEIRQRDPRDFTKLLPLDAQLLDPRAPFSVFSTSDSDKLAAFLELRHLPPPASTLRAATTTAKGVLRPEARGDWGVNGNLTLLSVTRRSPRSVDVVVSIRGAVVERDCAVTLVVSSAALACRLRNDTAFLAELDLVRQQRGNSTVSAEEVEAQLHNAAVITVPARLSSNTVVYRRAAPFLPEQAIAGIRASSYAVATVAAVLGGSPAAMLAMQRGDQLMRIFGCPGGAAAEPVDEPYGFLSSPTGMQLGEADRGAPKLFSRGTVLGNLLLILGFAAASLIVSTLSMVFGNAGRRATRDDGGDATSSAQSKDGWLCWSFRALAAGYFPGIVFTAAVPLFDGLASAAVFLVSPHPAPEPVDWVLGIGSFAACLAIMVYFATVVLPPRKFFDRVKARISDEQAPRRIDTVGRRLAHQCALFFAGKIEWAERKFRRPVRETPAPTTNLADEALLDDFAGVLEHRRDGRSSSTSSNEELQLVVPPSAAAAAKRREAKSPPSLGAVGAGGCAKRLLEQRERRAGRIRQQKVYFVERFGSLFDARKAAWFWVDYAEGIVSLLLSFIVAISRSVARTEACDAIAAVAAILVSLVFAVTLQFGFSVPAENLFGVCTNAAIVAIALLGCVATYIGGEQSESVVIAAEALNIVILLLTLLFVPVQLLSNLQAWLQRHHPKVYARVPWVARGRAPLPRRLPETNRRFDLHGDVVLSDL